MSPLAGRKTSGHARREQTLDSQHQASEGFVPVCGQEALDYSGLDSSAVRPPGPMVPALR